MSNVKLIKKLADCKPMGRHVLIKKDDPEEMTRGGIYIPQIAQERPEIGTVLAVGEGLKLKTGVIRPCGVEVGDRVMFRTVGTRDVKLEGEELVMVNAVDILCIIE